MQICNTYLCTAQTLGLFNDDVITYLRKRASVIIVAMIEIAMRNEMTKKGVSTPSRNAKSGATECEIEATGTVRTSVVIPKTVDSNLEVYVLRNGVSKGEIITKLLTEFLEKEGYKPMKMPKVEISY